MMKAKWLGIALVGVVLSGCEKSEQAPPKAEVVPEEPASGAPPPPPPADHPSLGLDPASDDPADPEDEKRTVGDHVDRAIEATGHGLQVAGEKTKQGVGVAAEKTGKALETAGEKTEKGVKKAAESTGRFFKKVGEKLENAAEGEPVEETTEP